MHTMGDIMNETEHQVSQVHDLLCNHLVIAERKHCFISKFITLIIVSCW